MHNERTAVSITRSTTEDAAEAAALLRRSVTELCAADHQNDPALLNTWCSNKTPENLARWISLPTNDSVAARDENGTLVGFGMIASTGELNLCYVLPEVLGKGVGKMLLTALLDAARERGLTEVHLSSTQTAHAFYRSQGFIDTSEDLFRGLRCFTMTRAL